MCIWSLLTELSALPPSRAEWMFSYQSQFFFPCYQWLWYDLRATRDRKRGGSEEICCPGRKCCNLYGERVFKSGPGKSRRKGATYHVWRPSRWPENCKVLEVQNESGQSSWIRTTREASADIRRRPILEPPCLCAGTNRESERSFSWGVGMSEILNRPCSCADVRASSHSAAPAKHQM